MLRTLFVLLSFVAAVGANATTFTFTGKGSAAAAANQTVDGITVTVSAPGEDLGYLTLDGLGVKTNFFNLSGIQNGETIRVDFSQTVNIENIKLRQWEGPDDAVLVGYGDGTSVNLTADSCWSCSAETFNVNLTGIDYLTLTGDSGLSVFFLAEISGVSAVPLPAAAWLFGSALFGLGFVKRRRNIA